MHGRGWYATIISFLFEKKKGFNTAGMWGGVKHKRDYSAIFQEWVPTKSIEKLRKSLFAEPRPWWIGWSLHQRQLWLDDKTCASLMRWTSTIYSLEANQERKAGVYQYGQSLFAMFDKTHRITEGKTFAQYLLMCEAAGDVDSAYKWIKYYIEHTNQHQLHHYVWLMRIATKCPNDAEVEDMIAAVREVYTVAFVEHSSGGSDDEGRGTEKSGGCGTLGSMHLQPESEEECVLLEELFFNLQKMAHRVDDPDLFRWIKDCVDALPAVVGPSVAVRRVGSFVVLQNSQQSHAARSRKHVSELAYENTVLRYLRAGMCCVFPLLEASVTRSTSEELPLVNAAAARPMPSIAEPFLVDSLFSDEFVDALETASFSSDVRRVTALVQGYLEDIAEEKKMLDSPSSRVHVHKPTPTNPIPVWRSYTEASHREFRSQLVAAQGPSAELYHYLITALANGTSLRLALSTKEKMEARGMRVLDLTRAVLVAACKGSTTHQLALIQEQLREVEDRKKLDEDFDTTKAVEAFWKFQYPLLFHYRNALTMEEFYKILVSALGVAELQRLVVAANAPLEEHDVVVIDESVRSAVQFWLRSRRGPLEVQNALDVVTNHAPRLDLALVNAIPCFNDYVLMENENIATTPAELRHRVMATYGSSKKFVFLMDASFVETTECFTNVVSSFTSNLSEALIFIPYTCLAQLAETVEDGARAASADVSLEESRMQEVAASRLRLRQLAALIAQSRNRRQTTGTPSEASVDVAVLHFTEALMSHVALSVRPDLSDDDQLIATAALLRAALNGASFRGVEGNSTACEVVLCTDDPILLRRVQRDAAISLLLSGVHIARSPEIREPTDTPAEQSAAVEMVRRAAEEPAQPAERAQRVQERGDVTVRNQEANVPTVAAETFSASSWLSMLDEDPNVDVGCAPGSGGELLVAEKSAGCVSDGMPAAAAESMESTSKTESAEIPENDDVLLEMFDEFASNHNNTTASQQPRQNRKSPLHQECEQNAGYSLSERRRLAAFLSNRTGRRVPFHFKYNVYEANINDPKNAHLLAAFQEQQAKKQREINQRSTPSAAPHTRP